CIGSRRASASNPTRASVSVAFSHGPGVVRNTSAHRSAEGGGTRKQPDRSTVWMSPLSRSTCSARDAVTTDTLWRWAIPRTLGIRPPSHRPLWICVSIACDTSTYLGVPFVFVMTISLGAGDVRYSRGNRRRHHSPQRIQGGTEQTQTEKIQ